MSGDVKACRAAALAYLSRGWSVIPLAPGKKHPLIRWAPYQQRRAEEREVRLWFGRWPDANIGIVTGLVSGLLVLDIDPQNGGGEALAALEARHGPLPATVEASTGGGGRHLYFRHPGPETHNKVGMAPGIDLRADGGLVVAPPSLHPSGRHYVWVAGRDPDAIPLAALPPWLLDRVLERPGHTGHPLAHWRSLVREGVAEGRRNDTIASFAGHLLWHGVDPAVTLELLLCWNAMRCRPPLDDEEVARTIGSIARLHQRQRPDDTGE